MSQKAWDEIKYSYTQNYRPLSKFHLNRNFGHEYNMHNDEETVVDNQYWEKKELDAFYSLSRYERIKLYFQSMVSFFYDLKLLIIINFLVIIFYARKKTREILVSNLYLSYIIYTNLFRYKSEMRLFHSGITNRMTLKRNK